MFRSTTPTLMLTLALTLLCSAVPARAEAVARVNGQSIHREEVLYLADFALGYKGEAVLAENVFATALKKALANHALFLKAQAEHPELVREAQRAADLAVARDYFQPFLEEIARPVVEGRTTVETVLEKIREREDLIFLYQITMRDRAELEQVRSQVLAGTLPFEAAARQYSQGNSAKMGGEVGGIKRTDDRYYPETLALLFDETPIGGITQVIDGRLSPSFYWVKDRKTKAERRLAEAQSSLATFVSADMMTYAWESVATYAGEQGGKLLITVENAQQFVDDPDRVVFRVAGREYTARDVLSRSGGMSHSVKDITTISENCYRDLILQQLYVQAKGAIETAGHRHAAMLKHLVARQYIRLASADLTVSDAEVEQYLADHQEKYALPDRADLGVIFVKTEQRVQRVQERLETEDFETVAKAWSQNKRLASVGGRLGVVPLGVVQGDFANLEPGTVLAPQHQTEGDEPGYYLFKFYRFYPAEPGTMANLGPQVVGGARSMVLVTKREERLATMMDGVLKGLKIELL